MFGPDGPTTEDFFARYWRSQPLFVKGGGAAFGPALDIDRFEAIAAALRQSAPRAVQEGGGGVTFLQRMDQVDLEFAQAAAQRAQAFGNASSWYDAVRTRAGSAGGIGCHYDDSDNFVLQQAGVKVWRLCPPAWIGEDELRRRMLRDPRVGNAVLDDEHQTFVLEPGDLLYIPIFWPHWGESSGESLSLSFVCNSANLLDTLWPRLRRRAEESSLWWKPLPITQAGSAEPWPPERLVQAALAVLREPWEHSNDEALCEGAPRPDRFDISFPDMAYVEQAPGALLAEILADPTGSAFQASLAHAGLLALRAFVKTLQRADALEMSAEPLERAAAMLTRTAPEDLVLLGLRPEVRLWTFRARQALAFDCATRLARLVQCLPAVIADAGEEPLGPVWDYLPYASPGEARRVPDNGLVTSAVEWITRRLPTFGAYWRTHAPRIVGDGASRAKHPLWRRMRAGVALVGTDTVEALADDLLEQQSRSWMRLVLESSGLSFELNGVDLPTLARRIEDDFWHAVQARYTGSHCRLNASPLRDLFEAIAAGQMDPFGSEEEEHGPFKRRRAASAAGGPVRAHGVDG